VYVIGTSGHIDHGKTTLILALTGIDCDRLPEEKERQMTIDIGFASMEVPGFGEVSVIDVPGHERFIRNMVAGAWGVDLGLLVIAADDGWMPQTEDHFRVLELLGVERIVAVISKTDLADADTIEIVDHDVRERLAGTAYEGADVVRVSAKTGEGIEALKRAITGNLAKLSRVPDNDKPFLYIDRVFASRGYGTVVTGTLKNGSVAENDQVYIQPGGLAGRIKRIESHHSALAQGSPSSRTALNLSGVAAQELRRGQVLYRQKFFTETAEILCRVRLLAKDREIKNNAEIEVLIGTAGEKGRLIRFSDSGDRSPFTARIKFRRVWYSFPGQPFVIASPGGFRIIGGGMVLLPDYDPKLRDRMKTGLSLFRSCSAEELAAFIIFTRQWIKKQELYGMLAQSKERIDAMLSSLSGGGAVRIIGEHIIAGDAYNNAMGAIVRTVKDHQGLNAREVSDNAGIDDEVCRLMMPLVQESHPVAAREGRYFWGEGRADEGLSEGKRNILEEALKAGGGGIDIGKTPKESTKRDVRELISLGLLVSLDGTIAYHSSVYEDFRKRIMGLFETREKISISDAKQITGLSRKYLIPLLNRIERDGLVRRLGDFRIKVK